MEFKFITDRDNISHLPLTIKEEVKRRNLFTSNSSNKISFCGVIVESNTLYLFIPRGSDYSKIKEMEYACLLMSTLEKYTLESSSYITTDDEDNIEIGLCYLTLAKELLKDYQSYGLYTKVSKKELINSGKINWKRTFQKQVPLIRESESPIYLKYNGYKYTSSRAHEISKIHAEIIHYLDNNLSWWLTKKVGIVIAPELCKIEKSKLSNNEKIYLLNQELNLAYSDQEIRLLKNLISFLNQDQGTASTKLVLGIKKFEHPWENMLCTVLRGKKYNNNEWLPIPVYKSVVPYLPDALRAGMRPDIYIEDDQLLTGAVIDAKYYDAKKNTEKSLPALGDILKQMCYVSAVSLARPNLTKIDNIFIFPGSQSYYSHIEFNHKQISHKEILIKFPYIKCIYLNPVEVIKAYVHNQYLDNVRTQILSVEI